MTTTNTIQSDKQVPILTIKIPTQSDGKQMWKIAKDTDVLDLNSSYSYNLIATHFNQTSAIGYLNHQPIGFLSAYFIPTSPQTLFIWQIGVSPMYQGRRVAFAMIQDVLNREVCQNVTLINTTIAPSNIASQKLFQKIAQLLITDFKRSSYFSRMDFPNSHEQEDLITIGPFNLKSNQGGLYGDDTHRI